MDGFFELKPGPRTGVVDAPPSKSHAHRLLIADFLAGETARLADAAGDSADIRATKRCLRALAETTRARQQGVEEPLGTRQLAASKGTSPVLDVGESGSTLRFLMPIAAALGVRPVYQTAGRLASRPMIDYPELKPGRHELAGDVSSQFVTGLLFALPLLKGDSQIRFTTPLESRGYVDMTLDVLKGAGIVICETANGFDVPGGQRFRAQPDVAVEGDWSGAAFWLAMNAFGSAVDVRGLNAASAQPDRQIAEILASLDRRDKLSHPLEDYADTSGTRQPAASSVDVSSCPDIFPVLTIVAAQRDGVTRFMGTRRLRLKESDRVAAMADVLGRLGRRVETEENAFTVHGSSAPFPGGGEFTAFGDHRVAMSVAVAATASAAPLYLDDIRCADKSYPSFFDFFARLCRDCR